MASIDSVLRFLDALFLAEARYSGVCRVSRGGFFIEGSAASFDQSTYKTHYRPLSPNTIYKFPRTTYRGL
eukprot:scaffold11784_cov99-Skeletonema_marinoi.AAC.3